MNLTVTIGKRRACVNGGARIRAGITTYDLERDDAPVESDAVRLHEEGWTTNAWCLTGVADALDAVAPLSTAQQCLLAIGLQGLGLVKRLPDKEAEELAFRAHTDRILGVQE
jgi:hypothetical protein